MEKEQDSIVSDYLSPLMVLNSDSNKPNSQTNNVPRGYDRGDQFKQEQRQKNYQEPIHNDYGYDNGAPRFCKKPEGQPPTYNSVREREQMVESEAAYFNARI